MPLEFQWMHVCGEWEFLHRRVRSWVTLVIAGNFLDLAILFLDERGLHTMVAKWVEFGIYFKHYNLPS